MDKDSMFVAITAHRLVLIDELDELDAAQWEAASLCGGWRVRDVVGHLVGSLDVPMVKQLLAALRSLSLDKASDALARRYGVLDQAELLRRYRGLADKQFSIPVIGPIAPLIDVLVHSLDITTPLGLAPLHDEDAAREVLDALAKGLPGVAPKSRSKGLHFEATDLGWQAGAGTVVRGPSGGLMLALTGRAAGCDQLEGDGVAILRSRLGG